jgi:hypothetical protein
MTINTHNRALIERVFDGELPVQMGWGITDDALNALLDAARAEGPVVATPPADEVGRAVERLTALAASEDKAAGGVTSKALTGTEWGADIIAAHRQNASDIRLIRSHVSRLEGDLAWMRPMLKSASETCLQHLERANVAEASLKLAVEALEPFSKIKPSSIYSADGSEKEGYTVFLDEENPLFNGADLARARDVEASRQSGEG